MPANFLGRLQTFLFGAAIGRAASDSVTPVLEPVRQHAWEKNQNKVLDPGTAAEALAQGIISETEGQFDSSRSGVGVNRFGVLWRLAQRVPGVGEARTLRRRSKADGTREISLAQLHHVYAKAQIEPQYWDGLDALVQDILSPGEIAAGIHRGLIADPDNLLLGEQPEPPFKIEKYPQYGIDALAEAMGHGFNRDRLGVLVGLQGLPMGVIEAAHSVWRKIITHGDYIRAFNTSNSRNEWAGAVLEYSRQIPTARDFLENALRGYRSLPEAIAGAALHGMAEADATMIYQNQGRPMNLRLITQALARGGKFKPEAGEITDPYLASIVEGNLKPAYYDLAYANRYTLPSVFAIRGLAQAGTWPEAKVALRLKQLGWLPADADEVAKSWSSQAGAATVGPWAKKAEAQLWTATHKSFVNGEVQQAAADAALASIGVPPAERAAVFEFWNEEKNITVKPLTPSQIKAAYKKGDVTIADAVARLELQHYTDKDANTYLTT